MCLFLTCVVGCVFEALASGAGTGAGADTEIQTLANGKSAPSKVIYHPVSEIDETAVVQAQATFRTHILRALQVEA